MTPCPSCSAPMKVSKSRINSYGERERRRSCPNCGRKDVVGSQPEVELWVHIIRGTQEYQSAESALELKKEGARIQV